MPESTPALSSGAAIGIDHVGIVAADLDQQARIFSGLGFQLTPYASHASGRTGNRCAMLRRGSYLELMATAPGQVSTTLDRFLAIGPGAHILALAIDDEVAARDRLARAGIDADVAIVERDAAAGAKARFAVLMAPDGPEGRLLLVRQLTPELLWRPDNTVHPNHATGIAEVIYAVPTPAETMTRLSRVTGRSAVPDALGGYRIDLARGLVRVLPLDAAAKLLPGSSGGPALAGLTVTVDEPTEAGGNATESGDRTVHAGGVTIRFTRAAGSLARPVEP
jgi:catechol 2,3-dioxygenase-like lactoylglutathione lyase family enzyme